MKHLYFIVLLLLGTLFSSCSSDEPISIIDDDAFAENGAGTQPTVFYTPAQPDDRYFPAEDTSTELAKLDLSTALYRCVYKTGDDVGVTLNEGMATEDELEYLAGEVEVITEGATTEKQKLDKIFNWVASNIKYSYDVTEHSAYYTFNEQKGICQGYANLVNVMCHIAGIPCFNVNGYATSSWLGHAWNCAKADGRWYVVDATHNRMHLMSGTSSYKDYYFPVQVDVTLFEDDNFKYTWHNSNLCITEVKQGNDILTVPFSINKLRISSFNPQASLPENIKSVYLGSNITHLGDGSEFGVFNNGKSVEAIHVINTNSTFYSENGVVYRRNGDEVQLNIVPPSMRWCELSDKLTTLEKNAIYHHKSLETLVIPSSVKTIEYWAVEDAPNLKWIYVPEVCTYWGQDSNYNPIESSEPTSVNFVGVHPDCQIIKGSVPTSIRRVTL